MRITDANSDSSMDWWLLLAASSFNEAWEGDEEEEEDNEDDVANWNNWTAALVPAAISWLMRTREVKSSAKNVLQNYISWLKSEER